MKVVVLLLCLVAAVFCKLEAFDERQFPDLNTCKTFNCIGLGTACETDVYTAAADCFGNDTTTCSSYCAFPMRCTRDSVDVANTCKLTTLGQLCVTNADCAMYYHENMVCSSGRCAIDTTNRLPNDFCSSNSNCRGSSTCVDGRCSGVAAGGSCTSTQDCAPSLYCAVPGVCTARDNGVVCVTSDSCTFTYSCIAGSCVADHTRTSGQLCNADHNCQDGLICTVHEGDIQQTCRQPSSPEAGQVCDEQDDCTGDGVVCACDHAGSDRCIVATPNRCSEAENAYYACLENAGCHQYSDLYRYGSCAALSCGAAGLSSEGCGYTSFNLGNSEDCFVAWDSAATMASWLSVLLSFF